MDGAGGGTLSTIVACVPIHDAHHANQVASTILYLHIFYGICAALGWAYNSWTNVTLSFALFAVVALEVHSVRLKKIYTVATVVLWLFDVFWLGIWARCVSSDEAALGQSNKIFHSTAKLVLAMVCMMFITRTVEVFVWLKLADMDYGGDDDKLLGPAGGANVGPPRPPENVGSSYRPFSFVEAEEGGAPPPAGAGGADKAQGYQGSYQNSA
mmetsp:Transcript_17578/g.60073  ORF Transcript_17578/g.60073 Transcript_17578/m.60073 type:complete len:212 (-) Transcript_17578:112-747(-)